MKYLKKTMPVEAIQYTGYNFEKLRKFTDDKAILLREEVEFTDGTTFSGQLIGLIIDGKVYNVYIKDYVVREENGVLLAVMPNEFLKNYEEVKE